MTETSGNRMPNYAKLTPEQRNDVAWLYLSGTHQTSDIARAYGVDQGTVLRHAQRRGSNLPNGYALSAPMPPIPPGKPRRRNGLPYSEHVDKARQARAVAGMRATYEARAALRRSEPPTEPPPPLTWYKPVDRPVVGPDRPPVTLPETTARQLAARLERLGWRAEYFAARTGTGYVEVRDLSIRGMPLVATLRAPEDEQGFLASHPPHGLKGRGRTPAKDPDGVRSAPRPRDTTDIFPPPASVHANHHATPGD